MNKDYINYLSEVGKGKKNAVVDTTIELLLMMHKERSGKIIVGDVGCFNGSMLSIIQTSLPRVFKKIVAYHGFDYNKKMLLSGKHLYSYINFHFLDLLKTNSIKTKFELLIVSNILHELYSAADGNKRLGINNVERGLSNLSKMLNKNGYLVLMDGVLPNNYRRVVKVRFRSIRMLKLLDNFSESYIIKPNVKRLGTTTVKMSLGDLSRFLSKYKYIDKKYWDIESREIYHFYTKKEYLNTLKREKIKVIKYVRFPVKGAKKIISLIPKNTVLPYKNILFVGKKLESS